MTDLKWADTMNIIEEFNNEIFEMREIQYNKETETKINKFNRDKKKNKFKLPKNYLNS